MIRYLKIGVKRFWARVTLLSVELLFVLTAFFTALIVFIFIARMIFFEKRNDLDNNVFTYLEKHINTVNTGIMQAFSFFGSHYFLIPANLILVAFLLVVKKQRWYSLKVPVISLSSLLLMFVLKQFFHRNRPLVPLLEQAKGLSFPSGHALMSFSFYGLLIYLSWHRIPNRITRWCVIVMLSLLIFFIGLSRIYLRVHYASDVIAGFSLGLIWLVLSLSILNKVEQITGREMDMMVKKQ